MDDLVEHWMSVEPITVDETNIMATAFQLMKINKVRRLPVLNRDNHLVGILTWGDVREGRPKKAKAATVQQLWDTHGQLAAIRDVQEFMTSSPIVISPKESILSAVQLMLLNKIGGLPVVEASEGIDVDTEAENRPLVGIITESDIFRFLLAHFSA